MSAALAPREAYRLWAPVYEGETAVSYLDDLLVAELTPPLAGKRLLDAGCGTGRRLRAAGGAALATGADLTWEMLSAGGAGGRAAAADVRALPFADAAFDVVWCRLVVGHLPSLDDVYAELARVCRPGGTVVVTDFHPDAAAAGHTRAFRDARGERREVEHRVHLPTTHLRDAGAAGLRLTARRDGAVGEALRPFYAAAGRLERYTADEGLAIVLALAFQRD
ncbi:MAG TPA: class I SAM-dependent methyltransferase [Longimicrobium sp.]|nr:class I SAM-dependent methyltransferase [Longimicrobium sp.]